MDLCSCLQGCHVFLCASLLEAGDIRQLSPAKPVLSEARREPQSTPTAGHPFLLPFTPALSRSLPCYHPREPPHTWGSPSGPAQPPLCQAVKLWPCGSRRPGWLGGLLSCHLNLRLPSLPCSFSSLVLVWTTKYKTFQLVPCCLEFLMALSPKQKRLLRRSLLSAGHPGCCLLRAPCL